jgi:hypothetical protein
MPWFNISFSDNLPRLSSGLLSDDQFKLTLLDSSNSSFPNKIRIQTEIFGTFIDANLDLIDGLWQMSSIYSDVYIQKDSDSPLNKADLSKVSYFIS